MSLEPCAVCGRPGMVGCEELKMTLCYPCDGEFRLWWLERDGRMFAHQIPGDWPGLARETGGAA